MPPSRPTGGKPSPQRAWTQREKPRQHRFTPTCTTPGKAPPQAKAAPVAAVAAIENALGDEIDHGPAGGVGLDVVDDLEMLGMRPVGIEACFIVEAGDQPNVKGRIPGG